MPNKAGSWTRFRRYIYANGLAQTAASLVGLKKKPKPTHLLLDGGRLFVPAERNLELLREYAHSYLDGEPLYLIEMKSEPVFRMMAEFDIKFSGDRLLTQAEIKIIVSVVQSRVIARAYADRPPEDLRVSVLEVEPKVVEGGHQSGIHLIWRIPVDQPAAWKLRAWMIRELESFFGSNLRPENKEGWRGAFDYCILDKNGLRLVGSNKAVPCDACRKTKKDDSSAVCHGCEGTGKVDKGRPYRLAYIADAAGNVDQKLTTATRKDAIETVLACTIRIVDPEVKAPWPQAIPAAEMGYIEASVQEERKSVASTKPKQGQTAGAVARPKKQGSSTLEDLAPDTPIFDAVSSSVRAEYQNVLAITRVKRNAEGDMLVANTSSHYCLNKRGEHAHSNVYFIITPKGIRQKCFCKKPDVQAGGGVPCSRYSSPIQKLPSAVSEAIFSAKVLGTARKVARFVSLEALHQSAGPRTAGTKGGVGPGFSSSDFLRALETAKFKFKY